MQNLPVKPSVIILTYNDEIMIGRCLESVRDLSDDIVVIDSFSTDKTQSICKEFGVRFIQHDFVNQGIQINWALDHVPFKYEWILQLDSDEILPPAIKGEIKEKIQSGSNFVGYYMNRRMYWMNKWLKYGRMYPHYILRLFRKGFVRWEECEEHHAIASDKCGYMDNDFLEDNRKNTLEEFTLKHLRTAESEVKEHLCGVESGAKLEPKLFGRKANRTRWLKLHIYSKVPLSVRALSYFIYRFFICLGFMDGREGRIFHTLQAFWYRYYIDARIFEKQSEWKNKPNDYTKI